ADTAVVLAGDEVLGIRRVVGDLLLGLPPIGAVLIDARVAVARARAAAEGMLRSQADAGAVSASAGVVGRDIRIARVSAFESIVARRHAGRLLRGTAGGARAQRWLTNARCPGE